MELEERCEELIRTLPLQSGRTPLIVGSVGAIFLFWGLGILWQLPPKPDELTLGLAIGSAVLGGAGIIFIGLIYLDQRFRRNTFREMLSGNYLAHWTYTDQEWEEFRKHQKECAQEKNPLSTDNFIAILILGGIFSGITALISWNWGEARLPAIGIAFVLGSLFAITVNIFEWFGWQAWCRGLKSRKGETFITPTSVYFHSRLYAWGHFGGRLKSLTFESDQSCSLDRLKFEVAVYTKNGEHIHTLEVPVPADQKKEAKKVIQALKSA